jgi:hypothetical protein
MKSENCRPKTALKIRDFKTKLYIFIYLSFEADEATQLTAQITNPESEEN